MKHTLTCALAAVASAALLTLPALADDAALLTPAKPGWPIAHPITTTEIAPPLLSLSSERGVNPAYVAGLPGLPQGREVGDDFGRRSLKYDGVFIRQSHIENGEVVIPAGGLAYLEDTWGGEVALRGEKVPVLGRLPTYIDYDMSIEIKKDVTIPAGGSAVVGGHVYQYYATVGHEQMANHTLQIRTVAGTDWDWAFGSQAVSATETSWWDDHFTQLYNQGKVREISRDQLVFDWLSAVRMDRMLFAEEQVFAGLAGQGDNWAVGERTIRIAALDEVAGTVTLELVEAGLVKASKTLGPIQPDRLIEDDTARKALVFEDGDMVAFLSPWPTAFEGGKANLKVYGKAFSLQYGADYQGDPRFAVYPIGCPTGHGFGFMLTNKQEIRLKPGTSVDGPEGYFKIAVNAIAGDAVTSWHIEDAQGNRSIDLGGPTVANIDLVLGQGRVAGQSILKDVGRSMLARGYEAAVLLQTASLADGQLAPAMAALPTPTAFAATPQVQAANEPPFSPMLALVIAILVAASGAFGYELARRRRAI